MPITPARHHAEWLSLLEISGPFLSMPVLLTAFPQGLDDFPPEEARSLRTDYEYWKENTNDPATHTAWVRLVLESMLGYTSQVLASDQAIPGGLKAEFPEHEETLRPDLMLVDPATHKSRLLIQVYPPGQDLEKGLQGSRWQASIATRMMELLHATEIRVGLATNGEQWMLVDAPRGETSGFTTWYANLWFDEPITLRALRSLLGVKRFFGVPDEDILESLLAKSAQDQQEVTDQLGLQVRHAVEILIQSLDRADQDQGRRLLGSDLPPSLLYEAALTVMMRLVFMLSAEERKLLPIDDDRYAAYYAVSTLREQLQIQADHDGEEVLERRYDAWSRLLAVFRAVYSGIQHQDLHLPPYGGSLFDPDRYPFLEGRPQDHAQNLPPDGKGNPAPLPVNNRTVLHLLDALQMLQVAVPGGPAEKRRLSFRALDVEQIGHVYEGLLDHMATRAAEPVLGLKGTKNQEPEVSLSALEKTAAKSEAAFLDWLKDQTGRSVPALKNGLATDLEKDADWVNRLRTVCGGEALLQRVLPYAGLLRADDLGFPTVILPGSVYVTAGNTRRATGTHYTPRSLTEPIVQHTLEPLVYQGPAEGWPRVEWKLHTPDHLLSLKICDMAMGSAGFLVQVVRYLSERLVEAWGQYGTGETGSAEFAAFGQAAAALAPEDQLIYARRLVAERCVYGVDKNPLAVEIAKLSLWLVTLSKDRPFTFLNHALKCGDSLVGTSEDDFLRWANRKKSAAMSLDQEVLREELEKARRLRTQLESFVVRDVNDATRKEALLNEAEIALKHIKRGADLLVGVKLLELKPQESEDLQLRIVDPYLAGELDGEIDAKKYPDIIRSLNAAYKEHAFHWEITFPEVFEKGGFDAFIGNPPFLGGARISTMFGNSYLYYLGKKYTQSHGQADICSYFFVKAFNLLVNNGCLGLIATNTISQGDTRESGLDFLLSSGGVIYRADINKEWPGIAAVVINIVLVFKGRYKNKKFLNNTPTELISSFLDLSGNMIPRQLIKNLEIAYRGIDVNGSGFILSIEEAEYLIKKDNRNKRVIVPYLVGQDVTNNYDQSSNRFIINFYDWPLRRGVQDKWETAAEEKRKKWLSENIVPIDYPGNVASDYPDCLELVQERVYPERLKNNDKRRREIWWQFTRPRVDLIEDLKAFDKVLVVSEVSKYVSFVFIPTTYLFSHMLVVFKFNNYSDFAILQSSFHIEWVHKYSSTLGTGIRYTPTDCFGTFPMPVDFLEKTELSGITYYEQRQKMMSANKEGLTATNNRFHNPNENSTDISYLRELYVGMDQAVASEYGWDDLALGHGFYETPQGIRYTISEFARGVLLSRLLTLNHERYEEEVRQRLHEEKGKNNERNAQKPKTKFPASPKTQPALPMRMDPAQEPELTTEPAEPAASTPAGQIGSWDQCVCLGCGKHLAGFLVEEHTKKVHQGKDPGYRKTYGR